jgi:CheY-like chemotaxis protein
MDCSIVPSAPEIEALDFSVRVRILSRAHGQTDGINLDRFQPGFIYDVGTTIANLLLAEGWAEPVDDERPAMLIPLPDEASRPVILVIDDDAATRAMLATLLTMHGYTVHLAEDGTSGLALLREHPPKLILLDLKMPRMNGPEFREQQRKLPGPLADIPVVIISGGEDAEYQRERLRARYYVPKPINDSMLLNVIGAVCGPVGRS